MLFCLWVTVVVLVFGVFGWLTRAIDKEQQTEKVVGDAITDNQSDSWSDNDHKEVIKTSNISKKGKTIVCNSFLFGSSRF